MAHIAQVFVFLWIGVLEIQEISNFLETTRAVHVTYFNTADQTNTNKTFLKQSSLGRIRMIAKVCWQ